MFQEVKLLKSVSVLFHWPCICIYKVTIKSTWKILKMLWNIVFIVFW